MASGRRTRSAEEWLMSRSCQRGWFSKRGARVAAQQAGQAGDALGHDRVALVGHRGAALLAGAERLHQLTDLGVLEIADLGGEALQRAARDRDGGEDRGVPIALDDLGAHRVDVEAEVGEHLLLEIGRELAVGADRPGDLPGRDVGEGTGEAEPIAVELEGPAGQLVAERRRLRVDGVRPPHHHRAGLAPRAGDDRSRGDGRLSRSRRSPAARSWRARPVSTTSLLVSPRWR